MGDLRVETRFKNAVLYNAMVAVYGRIAEEKKRENVVGGFPIIAATAEATGINRGCISDLLNLRINPWSKKNGERKPGADKLAEYLGVAFDTLFPKTLYAIAFPRVLVREAWSEEVLSLGEAKRQHLLPAAYQAHPGEDESRKWLEGALARLPRRERDILESRFGFYGNEQTLDQIAAKYKVGRERIRQIESRGMKLLRRQQPPYPTA